MNHLMRIEAVQSGVEGAVKAESLKEHINPTPARLALKELPCHLAQERNCTAKIPVPDGLTLGEWIDRETAGKTGQFVVLQLLHQEH